MGSLVIDSTNYALESRFNWRPVKIQANPKRSFYDIPLSQPIPLGTKVQASAEYYWLSGNKPSVDGVRIQLLNTAGTAGVGVGQNYPTAADSGKLSINGTLTDAAGFIRVYNGSQQAADSTANRYQFENIVVNVGDFLSEWKANVRDVVQNNNILTNSTWQLGGGNWQYNVNEWDILPPEMDKPTSNIAHSKANVNPLQAIWQLPNPVQVKAGQIIVVSFDYRESAPAPVYFAIRNALDKATAPNNANNQEQWILSRSLITPPDGSGWTRVTFRFIVNYNGFLNFIPVNSGTTGTNDFREIMVTTSGSLQGSYSWYQPDYTAQSVLEAGKAIPKVFVQSLSPTNVKDGDMWWKMSNNEVTNMYVWGNGQWNEQTIEQSVLNITTLNAVNINGSVISGSEFVNNWTIDIPATSTNPYAQRDIGFTKLADGKLSQENIHSVDLAGYIDTLKQVTTLEKGILTNKAWGYSPSGDFGYHREAHYDNGGLEFIDYSQVGTPTSTARLTPIDGLFISNVLDGGTAGVLPSGHYYNPSAITTSSGYSPRTVYYGTGAASGQTNTSGKRRIAFGANPSYGWGTNPNDLPFSVVHPDNNYIFKANRKCKVFIQAGVRIQGMGATADSADYAYLGIARGDSDGNANNLTDVLWGTGVDGGDSQGLNLQHAGTLGGYFAFSEGHYFAVIANWRSGKKLLTMQGMYISITELYN